MGAQLCAHKSFQISRFPTRRVPGVVPRKGVSQHAKLSARKSSAAAWTAERSAVPIVLANTSVDTAVQRSWRRRVPPISASSDFWRYKMWRTRVRWRSVRSPRYAAWYAVLRAPMLRWFPVHGYRHG